MVARVWVSFLMVNAFLGFNRLVQAVAPLPADHFAAGVFIDDDDFHLAALAALDDVILVAFVDDMGAHGLLHQMRPVHVVADVKAADAGKFLRLGDPFVRQMNALAIPFHFVILRQPFFLLLGFPELLFALLAALAGGFLLILVLGLVRVPFGALDGALGGIDGLFRLIPWLIQLHHFPRHLIGRLYLGASSRAKPLIINGVRASSIRIESTSSTIAKSSGPCT